VPRQKIRVIREAASRISKPWRRRDAAAKLHKECKVTSFSVETTRRLRKPCRDMELADRKAVKDPQRYRSVGPRVCTDGPVASRLAVVKPRAATVSDSPTHKTRFLLASACFFGIFVILFSRLGSFHLSACSGFQARQRGS
jgi:hypothetical protein